MATYEVESKQINTFIFLDLEATGLLSNGRPRITEISLIAVHRCILEESSSNCHNLPRVIDKFTTCVCPMKPISPGATVITGLHNDILEYQKDFDQKLVESINLFILRHEAPVCLVAHNGVNYDFGLLQSEFESIDARLPEDLLCVDSLAMFRDIDEELDDKNTGSSDDKKKEEYPDIHEVKRRLIFTALQAQKPATSNNININDKLITSESSKTIQCSSLFDPIQDECDNVDKTKKENKQVFSRNTNTNAACNVIEENPVSPGTADVISALVTDGEFDDDSFFDDDEGDKKAMTISSKLSEDGDRGLFNVGKSLGKVDSEIQSRTDNDVCSSPPAVCRKAVLVRSEINGITTLSTLVKSSCAPVKSSDNISSTFSTPVKSTSSECSTPGNTSCSTRSTPVISSTPNHSCESTSSTPHKTQSPWYTPQRISNSPYKKYKQSYKLGDIHERVMGYKAEGAHRAEDDCIALLRICQKMCYQVCRWADRNAVAVSVVPPLYSKSPRKKRPLEQGVFPYH